MSAPRPRILIVGGYGAFGGRAAERLANDGGLDIIVAGRSLARAQAAVAALGPNCTTTTSAAVMDAVAPDLATMRRLAPTVVINASGPFQTQDYTLAHAAINMGAHYIDLADASNFVLGFARDKDLDAAARAAGVIAVSGASTVPAISSAVLDQFVGQFNRLDEIHYGISPGNSFDPGPATTTSILGAIGRPFQTKVNGDWRTVHGWQGLSRHHFPGVGNRWMGYCNVPDLALFTERYPSLKTINFKAGVEVSLFHLGLWVMSWASRFGILKRPERLTNPLLAAKRWFGFLGTDIGGMFVTMHGIDQFGAPKSVHWHLIARQGHGPYIPTTPAVILAKKLARNAVSQAGASACVGLVSLTEIEQELADLDIRMTVS